MELTYSALNQPESGVVVFPVADIDALSPMISALDDELQGTIRSAIQKRGFESKPNQTLLINAPKGDLDAILLLGTGDSNEENAITELDLQAYGGAIYGALENSKITSARIFIEDAIGGFSADFVAASIGYGAKLRSYNFNRYYTGKKLEEKTPKLETLEIAVGAVKEAEKRYERFSAIVNGVFFARDLVTEPANVLNPESYATRCKDLKSIGLKVEVLGEKEMAKLGMGALLGVGQGSLRESHLVVMQWMGAGKNDAPVALVGKGVTFDTGGISIKPSLNMHEMKYDMGGSAAVVGTMIALAERKARTNVVGVIGLVENMPDGNAQRPGDVVTSMSGQTIEVLNTDAEGRLVLADALWYTQDRFKPQCMVNLATLTGAIVITFGSEYAGLFSNSDEVSENLSKAGKVSGEEVWRLPISKIGGEYDKQIDSKIADMQNIGNAKGAGSITAAQFLQRFVNDVPWAHLDIAGMAWANKAKDVTPEGGAGFGVRLLDRFIGDNYEL